MGYFELLLQYVMQSPTLLAILLGGLLAVLLALQQKDADGPPPQPNRRSAEADPATSGRGRANGSSHGGSKGGKSGVSGRSSSGDVEKKSSAEACKSNSAPTPFSQATWVPRDLSDLVRRHAPSVAPLVPALLQPPSGSGGGRGAGGGGAPFVLVALVPRQAQGRAGAPSAQELY